MLIQSPEARKTLNDYDFVFTSGLMMPVTIDLESGDTIEFSDVGVTIHLTPKPSMNNPGTTLPAEDITIFLKHLVSVQHRVREVTLLTPEQQFEWQKTLQELGGIN